MVARPVARNLYITAMEAGSGKSVVTLGMAELLSRRVRRLGFFRPIVPAWPGADPTIELIRSRYRLDFASHELAALGETEALEAESYTEVRKRVVERYRHVEGGSDFVLCEGTD